MLLTISTLRIFSRCSFSSQHINILECKSHISEDFQGCGRLGSEEQLIVNAKGMLILLYILISFIF